MYVCVMDGGRITLMLVKYRLELVAAAWSSSCGLMALGGEPRATPERQAVTLLDMEDGLDDNAESAGSSMGIEAADPPGHSETTKQDEEMAEEVHGVDTLDGILRGAPSPPQTTVASIHRLHPIHRLYPIHGW